MSTSSCQPRAHDRRRPALAPRQLGLRGAPGLGQPALLVLGALAPAAAERLGLRVELAMTESQLRAQAKLSPATRVVLVDADQPGAAALLEAARAAAPQAWRLLRVRGRAPSSLRRLAHQLVDAEAPRERSTRLLETYLRAPAARDIDIRLATSEAEREAAFELASRIYCEEHLGQPWAEGKDLFVRSARDRRARVWIVVAGDEIIATASTYLPEEMGELGLPARDHFSLPAGEGASLEPGLVQGGQTACHPAWRGLGLAETLWAKAIADLHRCGYRRVLILAASGVRDAAEIAGVVTQLHANDQLAPGMWLEPHADADASREPTRAPPTPAPVPRLIAHYGRVGFQLCGPPVYLAQYRMYDLPLCLTL